MSELKPISSVQGHILDTIAGVTDKPASGAYNFRVNGASIGCSNSENVTIKFKEDGKGIEVYVKPHTKFEHVHIPVVISESGIEETVLNEFFIGEGANVNIVAGCGIHNPGEATSRHDGVHAFYVGKDAHVTYAEKHYGEGEGSGERLLNPVTEITMEAGSHMEMDTVQIGGVDSTKRLTKAVLNGDSTLIVREKLLTDGTQYAGTEFQVELNGEGSSTHVISRSVAKGHSEQVFLMTINGNAACTGHSECDAIIMDEAHVRAIPEISANHVDAGLVHEAAIGKIAGEQLIKLMTLGLTQEEAEARIVEGFLK